MNNQEELNYKQAYYFLFNRMTDVLTYVKFLQGKAENICTDEVSTAQLQLDTTEMLKGLIDNIIEDDMSE